MTDIIGMPKTQTVTEKWLDRIGYIALRLGAVLIVVFIFSMFISSVFYGSRFAMSTTSLTSLLRMSFRCVVGGLIMMGLAQVLGSLRLIAAANASGGNT